MDFEVGSIQEGKVTGITKFGAFVSLPGGRSGLVHISEIAYSYVNDVKDFLQEGQEVKVKVINVDDSGRINLSIKKAMDPPAAKPAASTGAPRTGGAQRPASQSRPAGYHPPVVKEPETFEDRLKQFMQSSDSKLSEMRAAENHRGVRRGRK